MTDPGSITTGMVIHPGYLSFEWEREMLSHLGEWVTVTVSFEPLVQYSGRLLMFEDEGGFCVQDETGCITWAWPNLQTERANEPS